MRMTIGFKVFGVAIGLVVLMSLVAGISLLLVRQISHQLSIQAGVLLPVSDHVAGIEAGVISQQVQVERLRAALVATPRNAAAEQTALARIEALDLEILAAFEGARAELAAQPRNLLAPDSLVTATRAAALLSLIQREYDDFTGNLTMWRTQMAADDPGAAAVARAMIVREENALFDALDGLRTELATFTEKALRDSLRQERMMGRLVVFMASGAAILGLVVSALIVGRLVAEIRQLRKAVRAVQDGDLSVEVRSRSHDEVGDLAKGFDHMLEGLRAKERITETFGRYVDPRVVGHLLRAPELSMPGGDRRVMTVFFSDLVGFTEIGERLTPTALVKLLNAYLGEMAEPIRANDGVIDKFTGDAIMAYWGPPFVDPGVQAARAVQAALAQRERLLDLQMQAPEITGLRTAPPHIDMRIGITTGPVVVGDIGSRDTRNYTVIGDTVNLAVRLEGLCGRYGAPILVDRATRDTASTLTFREIALVTVKGRDEPVQIFAPLTGRESAALLEAFAEGVEAHRADRLADAEAAFRQCVALDPDDGPSARLLEMVSTAGGASAAPALKKAG